MSKPKIGLTTYRQRGVTGVWDTEMAMLPTNYIDSVTNAGALAVLLPPQPVTAADAESLLASVDALMVCGGRDVNPERYRQTPHPETDAPDQLRDLLEDELLSAAIRLGVPFLGICRGAQMLNVNRGGTLTQHLPDLIGDQRYQQGGGKFNFMDVEVYEGSALRNLLGAPVVVGAAMYHHQAIDQVGGGLRVVGKTKDGVVEALELENHPFGIAVQWHPEQNADDASLFRALVDAANKYRSSK